VVCKKGTVGISTNPSTYSGVQCHGGLKVMELLLLEYCNYVPWYFSHNSVAWLMVF